MTKDLELLKRKQKGKQKLDMYKSTFMNHIKDSVWLDLEESDGILENLDSRFLGMITEDELINSDESFIESDLMREIFMKASESSESYVFGDDFYNCGIFKCLTKNALTNAFVIAESDSGNTVFILDKDYSFYFRINFNDSDHSDTPNKIDIQKTS
ncbi:MAG: hypothetical protein AAGI25_19705 [Bacteroidota bacterium]